MRTNSLDNLNNLVFFDERGNDDDYVQIFGLFNKKRSYKWIKKKYIIGPENFECYKIFVPKSNGSGALGEVLSTPLIGHTQSFISIGSLNSRIEAENLLKYIKTKCCRVLLGILKITQDNPVSTWAKVPLQDFTSSSDIDWSQSVAEIDAQLYKKYGLSQEEIDFIESKVKAMD